MKKIAMLLLSLACCVLIATPGYARGAGVSGSRVAGKSSYKRGAISSREKKTDRKIERRVGREMDRKGQRRDTVRKPESRVRECKTDRKIERRTDREGERKEERRDEHRGADRRKVSVPEQSQGAKKENAGAATDSRQRGKEAKELYKENSAQRKDLYKENSAQRHDLYNENSSQRKELKVSLDTTGDGKLSKAEVAAGKEAIKGQYEENSGQRQELYQENKGQRHALYQENSQQRRDLLKAFDIDGDGKISQPEMLEANNVLESMEE